MELLTCFVGCLLILFYYVIKMKIKQLKIFFFCLYFNPVLSRTSFTTCTSVLQMYIVGNLVQRNSTCILYFGDVTFWLCRTSAISKYFLHSLGLWDNEVDLYIYIYIQSFFLLFLGRKFGPIPLAKKYVFFPYFERKFPSKWSIQKKKIGKMWRQRVGSAYKFVPCISHAVNLRVASLGDR